MSRRNASGGVLPNKRIEQIGQAVMMSSTAQRAAWAWCVADLLRDDAVDSSVRTQWLVALLFLSVVFIPAYVSVGPGRERWDPRMLWWPWKR